MEKSESLKDKMKLEIVQEEIDRFLKLISGHRKLLEAIAKM
jgi:hypothetical protein